MFQAPKKSEFSQLPSFGQIANTPLQAGNRLVAPTLISTSPSFTTIPTFPETSSRLGSSSFKNPSIFSTSSFPSKSSSVLFSDQTKSPNIVGSSQTSNLFASATTTTTNPFAGVFSTGTKQFTSFSSLSPSTSSVSYTTLSPAFGSSSRTDNINTTPNYFVVSDATTFSGSGSGSVFGKGSTTVPSGKSNPFMPSSSGLFASPNDELRSQTPAPFTTSRFESSSKGLVFSSQPSPPKSATSPPSWSSLPSEQLKTNPFTGTSNSSGSGGSLTGPNIFASTVPSSKVFQSSAVSSSLFQPNTESSVFTKSNFTSSSISTTANKPFVSAAVFSSTVDSNLKKSAPVTSSAFSRFESSQSSSIGQTVSKIFGSTSEGSFTSTIPVKDTKPDNIGLFGKPIESKSSFSQTVSSSSEVPKNSSTSSYEVGLFGKPEKKIECASEFSGASVSKPAKVGLFGKPLTSRELETDDRMTRKRSVSPKRSWSKPSHSSRHEIKSDDENSSSVRTSKTTQFGRLYSEMMREPKPASSRLSKKDEMNNASASSHSKRRSWNERKATADMSSDESRLSRRTTFSRQMSEDDMSKVALICKNIPSNFNKGAILHKHFSRFGKIARIIPIPHKRSANVHFKDHSSAYNAKYDGTVLAPGVRIQIFWHAGTRRTSTSYKDLDAAPPELEIENLSSSKSKSDISTTTSKKRSWLSNEVEEELQLMAGTNDIKEELVNTLDRPEDMPFIAPPPLAPAPACSSRVSRSHRSKIMTGVSQSPFSLLEKKVPPSIAEVKKMALPKSSSSLPFRKTENTASASKLNDIESTGLAATRVKLLDLYDRMVRKQLKKKSTLELTASALIGTCPDMCPEKERYDREAKRRLHVFEILAGTENLQYPKADHAKVVKEYSRSSADQDEPLSHELRPATVLLRTMTYLLTEIANKGQNGNWHEWYDFLWDRTRGIRKDITQQMMCNVETVALIEKCARFHIFSAERLCEEEMSVFSHKINDENLTKCLQSLKYLYADMERKHKIFFETESEFRAYVVLMNLNEGDMLREVQTLRPDILSSSEIHFALQVYSAINSNNYIKFFKLIRKATFLNACILHRYFPQVRSKALMILMRALSSSSRPVPYPLEKLVETLGFESIAEAAVFCRHYGFIVENDDVLLDRVSFVEPEIAPEPQRSLTLVESKCNWTIGDVINGGPLPHYELLTPTTSFDKDGNLKPEKMAKNVKKEKTETFPEEKVKPEEVVSSEHPTQSLAIPSKLFNPYRTQEELKPELQTQYESTTIQELPSQIPQSLQQQKNVPEQPKMVEESPKLQPGDSTELAESASEIATVPVAKTVVPATQPTVPAARTVVPATQPAVPAAQPAVPATRTVISTTQSTAAHLAYTKQLTLDIIKELARDMFLEVIAEFATSIAKESVESIQILRIIANEILEQTHQMVVDSLLRELSQQVCEEISLEQQQLIEKLTKEKKLLEEKKKIEEAALQKKVEEETLKSKRLAEEQQRLAEQQEKEERTRRVTEDIVQDILEMILTDEVKQVSNEQMVQVEKELKDQTIEECSQETKTNILHEVIDEMCFSVCQQIYMVDVELRLKELDELENCISLYRLSKVLQQWKKACILQQKKRHSLQTFPACPSFMPTGNQLKKLCGPDHAGIVDESLLLNKRAKLSIESPICISRRDAYLPSALTLCRLRRHLMQQKAWYPLDIQATVSKELLNSSNWEPSHLFTSSMNRSENRLYWKLLISFPELDEEADDVYTLSSLELCDWLKSKLTKGARPESTLEDKISLLSLYKVQLNEQAESLSAQKMLNFCACSVTGILEAEDIEHIEMGKLFFGSSGLLYILPVMQTTEDNEDEDMTSEDEEIYWLEEQTRLATLLQAKPVKPSIPLAVVMPRHKKLPQLTLKEFSKKMNLQKFMDQELISSVSLFTLPFCLKTPGIDVEHYIAEEKLTGSLKWLASRIPTQPLLEKKHFRDYIEDFLSEEFYGPVLYNQKVRQAEGYLQQSPHVIIDLYNSVIDHLTACATDKELLKYSWPVTEFQTDSDCDDLPSAYWNSEENLIGIGNQLLELKLPEFEPVDEFNENWSNTIEDLWNYIKIIIGEGPDKTAVELVSKVRNLLIQIETRFSETCRLEFGYEGCLPTAENMAWLDIILYCIDHLLITAPCLDTSSLDEQDCPQEIEVVYRKTALKSFKPDATWRDAVSEKRMREGPTLKSTYILSISQMTHTKKDQTIECPKTEAEHISFSLDQDMMTSNAKSISLLKTSLNAEKLYSHSFEDFLERSLHEGFFENENSFGYSHFGEGDAPTLMDNHADQSNKSDLLSCDVLNLSSKSMEYEDDLSPDFEAGLSLQDKMTLLQNELESCRKGNSFMECCLNSLIVDPYLVGMDHTDQDQSIHDEQKK